MSFKAVVKQSTYGTKSNAAKNKSGTLTINRGGSVGEVFYQDRDYLSTPVDVRILTSKLNDSDHNIETEIVGPICESSDKFMRTTKFANIEEGDNVVIKNVGAYGSTMSSNYNARPFIEELLIDKEEIQIIRKKQSFDDFIKNEL